MKGDSTNFKEWLERAENDLKAARAILEYYEDSPTDTVCYHAHQAVEKCLKAFLLSKKSKVARTHDLVELLNLCRAEEKGFEQFRESAQSINKYYIETRYPPDLPVKYPKEEAREAVSLARQIWEYTEKVCDRAEANNDPK